MTWSYSGNPAASDRDEVRFLIGDTNVSDQLLSDEEIDYLIGVSPDQGTKFSNYQAAAQAALGLAAKYTRLLDKTVGSLSIRYSGKRDAFLALAERLTATATTGLGARAPGVPVLGGGGKSYLMGDDYKA